jgi:hypothetical protein
MTDAQNARGAELNGVAPRITSYTGASRPGQQESSTPPDPNGAVNANYIVEFINGVFSVYDKQTGGVVSRVSDGDFWRQAGIPQPMGYVDPRIVFIPDAGRGGQWLAVQLRLGTAAYIATTDPRDPLADPRLGQWNKWKASQFSLSGNDFAMLGYDLNGVYLGTNAESGQERLPEIVVIPRSNALAYPPQVGPDDIRVLGPLNKYVYGEWLYPVIDQSGAGWPYETVIGVDNFSKKHLTYALISPQFRDILSHGRIEVPAFEPVRGGYRVKQPFDVSNDKSNVIFDNSGVVAAPMGDGFNIWVAHTVWRTDFGSLVVRWYRLYIDPVTRQPGLASSGEISRYNYDHFNPSILSFGKDDYTIVSLSRSGNSSTSSDPASPDCGNIGAYAALVTPSGPYKTFTLRSGQANNYIPQIAQRWGDYSTICRDPTNPRTVWIFNQYVVQGGPSTSQTCDVIARMDLG